MLIKLADPLSRPGNMDANSYINTAARGRRRGHACVTNGDVRLKEGGGRIVEGPGSALKEIRRRESRLWVGPKPASSRTRVPLSTRTPTRLRASPRVETYASKDWTSGDTASSWPLELVASLLAPGHRQGGDCNH